MRLGTAIWLAILAVWLGATVVEVSDAELVWRHMKYLLVGGHKEGVEPTVPDELVAMDPEAGDVLSYGLKYARKYQDPEELAALVEKYPKNEFFLARLAERLAEIPVVDRRAPLAVVDRLLSMDPNNAHYRYLRGWALLTRPEGWGREQEALSQLEMGHRLPQFRLPYDKYRQRIDRLYEQAGFAPWDRSNFRPFYGGFGEFFRRSHRPYEGLDRDTFDHLSQAYVQMACRLVDNASDTDLFLSGTGLLRVTERARLSKLDLPEAEARAARLHLGQAVALNRLCSRWSDAEFDTFFSVAVMIFPFGLILAHVLNQPIGWLVCLIAARRRPACQRSLSVRGYTFFVVGMGGLLSLMMPMLYGEFIAERWGLGRPFAILTLLCLFASMLSLLGISSDVRPVEEVSARWARRWSATVCGLLWLAGFGFYAAWHSGAFGTTHAIHWERSAPPLVAWSAYWLLVWSVATYLPHVFRRIPHNRLVVPVILWAAMLLAVPIVAAEWRHADRLHADLRLVRGPLPPATQDTYERMILADNPNANTKDPDVLPDDIGYATPQDLAKFLAGRRAEGRPLSEERLRSLLERCGRDSRSVILRALKDPNALEVLVTRAKYGDHTVKPGLEQVFKDKLAAFSSMPEAPKAKSAQLCSLLDLAGTVAGISTSEEAEARLQGLLGPVVQEAKPTAGVRILPSDGQRVKVVYSFWQALGRLPKAGALRLLKSYLRQTDFFDLYGAWEWNDLTEFASTLTDADRELAEEVIEAIARPLAPAQATEAPASKTALAIEESLTRHRIGNSPWCLEALFSQLGPESIPLLSRHLHSDNDQLRAFAVYRLTSLGHELPSEQAHDLLKDSSWKVRLNALFACAGDDLRTALADESAVVRAVAQVLLDER
jgi:hypothetical protein